MKNFLFDFVNLIILALSLLYVPKKIRYFIFELFAFKSILIVLSVKDFRSVAPKKKPILSFFKLFIF